MQQMCIKTADWVAESCFTLETSDCLGRAGFQGIVTLYLSLLVLPCTHLWSIYLRNYNLLFSGTTEAETFERTFHDRRHAGFKWNMATLSGQLFKFFYEARVKKWNQDVMSLKVRLLWQCLFVALRLSQAIGYDVVQVTFLALYYSFSNLYVINFESYFVLLQLNN